MVTVNKKIKVGFIVEGGSEKVIVESTQFRDFLDGKGYELVTPVIDAKGGGNLLPQNIESFVARFDVEEVDHIFVLTDLENEPSVDAVRQRIQNESIQFSFVAVKALEAWYLADSAAMNSWLDDSDFHEAQPEQTQAMPWDRLKEIATERGKRGPGQKISFAKKITKHHGFSLVHAAQHQNCPSATELVDYFTQGIADAD